MSRNSPFGIGLNEYVGTNKAKKCIGEGLLSDTPILECAISFCIKPNNLYTCVEMKFPDMAVKEADHICKTYPITNKINFNCISNE